LSGKRVENWKLDKGEMLIQLWADERPARSKGRRRNNTILTQVSETFKEPKTFQYLQGQAYFTGEECIP